MLTEIKLLVYTPVVCCRIHGMQKINNMYTQLDPMKSMIQQLKKDKDSALKKVDKLKIEMSDAMKKLQVGVHA